MVATATLWTTSDALRMIEDVQTLMDQPDDRAVIRNLLKEQTQLAADRRTALAQEHAADTVLDTELQPVDLPAVVAGADRLNSRSGPGSSGRRPAPGLVEWWRAPTPLLARQGEQLQVRILRLEPLHGVPEDDAG